MSKAFQRDAKNSRGRPIDAPLSNRNMNDNYDNYYTEPLPQPLFTGRNSTSQSGLFFKEVNKLGQNRKSEIPLEIS